MAIDLKSKKLLKEWDKIKDSDVFSSLESFAEFYYSNGEKKCFRINTNEPWSKDNFFFGEYADLLVYYKEEQPKKRIGQKFHSLTIIEVFWQEDNGKEELFAKCKCDCGNETIKKVDAMVKGNARTCGCNRGRRASTAPKKIKPISQELIDELWDFEKNDVDPQTISCDSTQKYWWKNNHGVSFELAPFVFLKPDTQTSFPEQAIFYHIKKNFNDAINKARYITQYGEIVEIDVYIPSLNIGIEYDGLFWHKDKLDVDEAKNQALNNDGIYVIRVREEGLPTLTDFYGKIIIRDNPTNKKTIINCINDLIDILSIDYSANMKALSQYDLYELELIKDTEVPFIEDTCLRIFWDQKKNGELIAQYVKMNSSIPYWFSCANGETFEITPIEIYAAAKKHKYNFYYCNLYDFITCCTRTAHCCPFKVTQTCKKWRVCEVTKKTRLSKTDNFINSQTNHTKAKSDVEQSNISPVHQKSLSTIEHKTSTSDSSSKESKEKNVTTNKIYIDDENTNDKQMRRSQSLCQYCGSSFKRKYLIFGEFICVKCGKKKDY